MSAPSTLVRNKSYPDGLPEPSPILLLTLLLVGCIVVWKALTRGGTP